MIIPDPACLAEAASPSFGTGYAQPLHMTDKQLRRAKKKRSIGFALPSAPQIQTGVRTTETETVKEKPDYAGKKKAKKR